MSEPCDLTAWELASRLATRELSSAEIVRSSLDRIHAVDDRLGAFLTLTPEVAQERAEQLDTYLATGAPQNPAAGIPLALKDVLVTNGIRTTCASKILETYIPPYDCTPWQRLSSRRVN